MLADDISPYMEAAARKLWGEPNARLSTSTELRFGAHGARSVDLAKGVWFDNEAGRGGGVLDLIEREAGCKNGDAVRWLREELGADLPDNRERPPATTQRASSRKIVATYDYIDENGEVLFQVVRFEPKDFRQRRPDSSSPDGWSWSVKGVRQVPYRLPDLMEAVALEKPIYVVEGEKDADALWARGVAATCNAGGAGKWPAGLAEFFTDADVVLVPDNDDAGRNHARVVGSALKPIAKRIRTLEIPDLPPKGDVSDWLAEGYPAEALYEITKAFAKGWRQAIPQSRFGAIQWSDLDRVSTRLEWLVKGQLHAHGMGLIFGASGSGKSFLGVDMGLSIARGVPFLGHKTHQGAVIYQAGEGGVGLVNRLLAYRLHYKIGEDVPFILLPARANLFSPEGDVEAFEQECLAWRAASSTPLAAIFCDTFSAASPGANENASEDMGRMLSVGRRISASTGAAFIWVHHKNAAGERERGHSSFRADVDTAWEVNRPDPEANLRQLRLAKLKDGVDGLRIGFELQSVTIGSDDDGDDITSCVVVPAQEGSVQTGKRAYLPPGQYKFLKLLDDAIAQYGGVIPAAADERIPTNMMGVDFASFRDLYARVGAHGMEDNAVRQALKRDGEKLFNDGIIDRFEHWIWITDKGRSYCR